MTHAIPVIRSGGAIKFCQWGRAFMDVILHVGAHRTATTSFQNYMQGHSAALSARDVAFWGPKDTRKSLFPGLFRINGIRHHKHPARHAEGRIKIATKLLAARGTRHLIVSDENMIGTCAHNVRTNQLYPAIGERMARVAAAFEGQITRIVLSVRAQDLWWASAAALTVSRGHKVPDGAKCRAITRHPRSWRDVVTDLACAVPDVDICVMPFERNAGQSDTLLGVALDQKVALGGRHLWLNRSAELARLRLILRENGADPDVLPSGAGRWHPFTTEQCAALRETYADDLHWLTAGADGLARLTEDFAPPRADINLPRGTNAKGQRYEQRYTIAQEHLAEHR